MTPPRQAEILRKGFDEYRQFVNPLIFQRASLAGEPIHLVRAEGGALCDPDGRLIEDFHGTQAFGHRPPSVVAALQEFLATDAPTWYPSRVSPFAGRAARMLCERSGYTSAFFACTGSDAVEAGLKLARAATRRPRILGLEGGYHGCSFGSVALMQAGPFRDPFGPHLPGVESLPFDDAGALEAALAAGGVGAVVVEPIQGEGGVRALSPGYVAALCELTVKHDVLLIADEVQTSLGRSGDFLASASWPRRPDAVLLGKQLGGGLVPVSAMLTRRDLFERAYGADFEDGESHNTTFGYNALGSVAVIAALDLLTDALLDDIRRKGERFRAALRRELEGSPLFCEIRGRGQMVGVALRQPAHAGRSFEHIG